MMETVKRIAMIVIVIVLPVVRVLLKFAMMVQTTMETANTIVRIAIV